MSDEIEIVEGNEPKGNKNIYASLTDFELRALTDTYTKPTETVKKVLAENLNMSLRHVRQVYAWKREAAEKQLNEEEFWAQHGLLPPGQKQDAPGETKKNFKTVVDLLQQKQITTEEMLEIDHEILNNPHGIGNLPEMVYSISEKLNLTEVQVLCYIKAFRSDVWDELQKVSVFDKK